MSAKFSRKYWLTGLFALLSFSASAQVILSPSAAASNHSPAQATPKSATEPVPNAKALEEKAEQIRTACIHGRRRVCGRVVQIVPEGLVVESGYTNLLRPEFSRSWVAPRTVIATRPPNLIEENNPGSVCVGLVFVTDIPKKPRVALYDYVILQAYPAGDYVYSAVPTVKKTLRKFSVDLRTAIRLNFDSAGK